MSNLEIVLAVSVAVNILLIYTSRNLLKKNEKQEDVMAEYLLYMDRLSKTIEYAQEALTKLDTRGIFEADDEIGWFFGTVKQLQGMLNKFKLIDEDGASKEKEEEVK
jgi:hypothetical protein|tara:strand:- start:1385 stop:1705 length:321 start_codon:yes stop_codon:yes gene_type:complete